MMLRFVCHTAFMADPQTTGIVFRLLNVVSEDSYNVAIVGYISWHIWARHIGRPVL